MGSNRDGCLGIGDFSISMSTAPCLVVTLQKFHAMKVSCGSVHTAALLNYGELYGWGKTEHGSLEANRANSLWTPVKVQFPVEV